MILFTRFPNGVFTAVVQPGYEALREFFLSEIQGSIVLCESYLARLEAVVHGTDEPWCDVGNAVEIGMYADHVTLAVEYDQSVPMVTMSIEEFRTALQECIAWLRENPRRQ